MPGRDVEIPREMAEVKAASEAFHRRLAHPRRPEFMDDRDDPWAFGDRLAFDEAGPVGDEATLELIAELRAHLAPVSAPGQVIHGDILGNVLLADGLASGVIDWPPYFGPAAIAVTDAVTFHEAPLSMLDEWAAGEDWTQLLIRALLYRLGPTGFFASHNRLRGGLVTHLERVRPVMDAVLAR